MKKKLIGLSSFALVFAPFVASAAPGCTSTGVNSQGQIGFIICKIGDLLATVVPIVIVLGVVYFVWGVITYVISSDEEAKKAGKDRMIYGIIGLTVIVAMWGLVGIVDRTFGLTNTSNSYSPPILGY